MNAFEQRQKRRERLVVMLTAEEKDIVQRRAEQENLSMSEFLRVALMAACGRSGKERDYG